jgi:4-amino-4-deoxy-L-arabinose transferase-like glycosyltransferase
MPLDDPTSEPSAEPAANPSKHWEWLALAAVLCLATGLRVWKLDQNGTGNPYYGACVRSMLASPSNFFFASFDPIGIVTVDKPPVALWIQGASAKVFGFSGWSVLLPQAIMGVVSVFLTYHLVRRVFGTGAGLIAGLALAVTPICVAIDRDNLPDTALVLVLLLAAWSLSKAAETGKLGPLLGSLALVGLAFNIKMLAAFVVLPAFAMAYLPCWLASTGWKTRVVRLVASAVVLVATSLSWSIAVELIPKAQRPYIGGSRGNSSLELALGYNGLARIMGMGGFGPGGGRPGASPGSTSPGNEATKPAEPKAEPAQAGSPPMPPGPGGPPFRPGGPRGGPGFGGTPGFARFANPGIIGLITWLFPLAILGGIVAATRSKLAWPIGREHFALVLWGGWLVTHWVVFSFAQGIFHEYYTTVMGPAVAALAGIGVMALWDASKQGGWRTFLFPIVILSTAAWQGVIVKPFPDWKTWLLPTIAGASLIGSIGVVAFRGRAVAWSKLSASLAVGALLIGPTLWSLGSVLAPGISMMPASDPTMLGVRRETPISDMPFGPGGPMASNPKETAKLVRFLLANHREESILIASQSSMEIAPIIIETGEPAISLGGFMGADPAVSKDQFIQMVESGKLRFF